MYIAREVVMEIYQNPYDLFIDFLENENGMWYFAVFCRKKKRKKPLITWEMPKKTTKEEAVDDIRRLFCGIITVAEEFIEMYNEKIISPHKNVLDATCISAITDALHSSHHISLRHIIT